LEVGGLRLEARNRVKLKVEGGKIEVERLRRWEGGPAAVGGALQAPLFELRPDKSLEVGGKEAQR
jgi:hypothetical protein